MNNLDEDDIKILKAIIEGKEIEYPIVENQDIKWSAISHRRALQYMASCGILRIKSERNYVY